MEDFDTEDLAPESITMRLVGGGAAAERETKSEVAPWLRYLWQSYRTVLDVLRNNAKLHELYQHTARNAFKFCLQYQRGSEFRRLCEILRQHLTFIQSVTRRNADKGDDAQPNTVDLTLPETQKLYLTTRFAQLHAASELELWQEAYRTIEDIHEVSLRVLLLSS